MAIEPGRPDNGMSKEMTPAPINSSQDRPKRNSRLAVISLGCAFWSLFVLFSGIFLSSLIRQGFATILTIIWLPAFVILAGLGFVLGIVAIAQIWRSRGQLTGIGMAIVSICLGPACVLLLWPVPIAHPVSEKTIAKATLQALTGAMRSYHNEYDYWPQPRSSGDLVLIFNGLRDPRTGEDIGDKRPDLLAQNPRRIQFLEFKARDVTPRDSFGKTTTGELAFYDPWGTPYAFAFHNGIGGIYYRGPRNKEATIWHDSKTGEKGIPLPFATTSDENNLIEADFAFFSNGPDRCTGTTESARDDIRSWR